MISRLYVRFYFANFVGDWAVLVVPGDLGCVAVESGRKHDGLAVGGGLIEDAPNRGEKTHVGHTVGFVDDNLVDFVKAHRILGHEVFQPTGAGHQDVYPPLKLLLLDAVAHAAVYGADLGLAGKRAQFRSDLVGELTGRG